MEPFRLKGSSMAVVFKPCKHTCPAHFVCLPYQTHLIQLISLLVESARPELGVSDKRDIQNVQGKGACMTGLKTTVLGIMKHLYF